MERALASRRFGPYTLQAAIAAVHAEAATCRRDGLGQIVALYDALARPSRRRSVELNRAVAVAMRDGPAAGLALVDAILEQRRSGGLSPGPRGAGGSVPAAGQNGGGTSILRARHRARAAGTGAAVSRRSAAGFVNEYLECGDEPPL